MMENVRTFVSASPNIPIACDLLYTRSRVGARNCTFGCLCHPLCSSLWVPDNGRPRTQVPSDGIPTLLILLLNADGIDIVF